MICSVSSASASTRYVNTTGWWLDTFNASSTPISAAIGNSSSFDTVYVYNGSYTENVLTISLANFSLTGEGSNVVNLVLPALWTFSGNNQNISGFNFSDSNTGGIKLSGSYSNFSNNTLYRMGKSGAPPNAALNVAGNSNVIQNNNITLSYYYAVTLMSTTTPNSNQFINNTISGSNLIYISGGTHNSFVGGSMDNSTTYDINCYAGAATTGTGCGYVDNFEYLTGLADNGTYFIDTNFSVGTTRKINMNYASAILNITGNGITIKEAHSETGYTIGVFSRTIYSLSSTNVTFKDSGAGYRGYRLSGLLPTNSYSLYKDGVYQSSLVTDSDGDLDYFSNIELSDTIISVVRTIAIPEIETVTTGNFFVNTTWNSGFGILTDSYNSTNGTTWINNTNNYRNTTLSPHAWQNLTIYAYNNTYDILSPFEVTNNTQIPNNPIIISDILSSYIMNEGKTLNIDANYTDADSDIGIFGDNSIQWNIDSSGVVSWTTGYSDSGIYNWYINVTDGYGGTSTQSFMVTVNDVLSSTLAYDAVNQSNSSLLPTMIKIFSVALLIFAFGIVFIQLRTEHPNPTIIFIGVMTAVIGFGMLLLGNYLLYAIMSWSGH